MNIFRFSSDSVGRYSSYRSAAGGNAVAAIRVNGLHNVAFIARAGGAILITSH